MKHTSSRPVDKADGTLAKFPFITSFSKSSLGYCFQCSGRERSVHEQRGTQLELSVTGGKREGGGAGQEEEKRKISERRES